MLKLSINILTKNRDRFLERALNSVYSQTFQDFEIVLINDASTDKTIEIVKKFKDKFKNLILINHEHSLGITLSRQEALKISKGEYIAILDDDDEWVDVDKLKKQIKFLDNNLDHVLVGGAMLVNDENLKTRPTDPKKIRTTMFFRNNFFTSSVVFRRQAAVEVGGFLKDEIDLAEDYDLWFRLGKLGEMSNFNDTFVNYTAPIYNKDKFLLFFKKQLSLIKKYRKYYKWFYLAKIILVFRICLLKLKS